MKRDLKRMAAKVKQARDLLNDARVIGHCQDDREIYSLSLLVEAAFSHASVLYAHLWAQGQNK